jgi:hypothetical protein
MVALFAWLGQLFVSLFTWAFSTFGYKFAVFAAFITAFVAAIAAYISAYTAIVSSIELTMPEIVAGVWGWFMPSNVSECLLAMFSCVILKFATQKYLTIVNQKVNVIGKKL